MMAATGAIAIIHPTSFGSVVVLGIAAAIALIAVAIGLWRDYKGH